MKKLLPNNQQSSLGFTLIELLVVVAIIAIISVIAYALFANATIQGRNGKRLAELEQITQALEQNRVSTGATPGYVPLSNTQFASSVYPGQSATAATDPQGYAYIISNAGAATANPAAWTTTTPANYTAIANAAALPAAGAQSYKICAIQEGLSGGAATVTCRTNLQ